MGVKDFIFDKLSKALPFEPTTSQKRLLEALSSFAFEPTRESIMVINGHAGTGKSSSVAALVTVLKEFSKPFTLMAPTGRAAKVLSKYTDERAYTIHKQIYRQSSIADGIGSFTINYNKNRERLYIVDEASLISSNYSDSTQFGSGRVLDDLFTYLGQERGNKLILIGDSAQLPPVGEELSKALDIEYLRGYGELLYLELKEVVRQERDSGILHNATLLREMIERGEEGEVKFELEGFDDIEQITGEELIESLSGSYQERGMDETILLCRSNRRANIYNKGIREQILYRDERITRGDKLMVVKNCYHFAKEIKEIDFIANGDVAKLLSIRGYQELYGLTFADATLSFADYDNVEIEAKVILDTLESESASLPQSESRRLFELLMEDYSNIKNRRKRVSAVREDSYFNALQIKFANAITCHKSQGGEWSAVYIDNPFWNRELTLEEIRWLYTALTRAVDKLYFVNFAPSFFI